MDVARKIRGGAYANTLPYTTARTPEGVAARAAYSEREREVIAQFWADVHAEHGWSEDDPRVSRLCAMAWDHGHASGLSEVLSWVDELSALL